MAPRENDFPQEALGLHLATLTSRKKADYTDRQIARLDHFIRTNRGFQRFLKAHNDKVTISTLRSFDLTELRVIFGCDGLEGPADSRREVAE
ncbi:hypothetical protein M7I_7572 [Glarea lozoyensis 74030]|uniref:Uncharacterized protein n=1 Tax=Glarea lozoyensis (strain ATCC 74030 / MF5533) TaxID=1104152 RepID=H0EXN3_GLAL7|nr:hypothetical protein M7I_7572 [Glarea lozoyensis 74030]